VGFVSLGLFVSMLEGDGSATFAILLEEVSFFVAFDEDIARRSR
jgi:hypothetical protein